ncbi:MAG: hypothetical protein OXL95_12160 [Nitrospira sp.]|nr:hypothetical protein [Nitrospira sp.]
MTITAVATGRVVLNGFLRWREVSVSGWRKTLEGWRTGIERYIHWLVLVALVCSVLMALLMPPIETTERESAVAGHPEPSPVAPPPSRDVTLPATSLTTLELMEIVALGGQDAVQSQIGLSIQVHGEFNLVT